MRPDEQLTHLPSPPAPGALSSDATVLNGTAYVTVIPLDDSGELAGDTIESQSEAAIRELQRVLRAVGSDLERVAHLTIYLTDIAADRAGFNAVYAAHFTGAPPVRCAVGVAALARPGMLVELTAVAAVPTGA